MQIFFFCNVTVLPKVSFMTAEGNLRILAEIIERWHALLIEQTEARNLSSHESCSLIQSITCIERYAASPAQE